MTSQMRTEFFGRSALITSFVVGVETNYRVIKQFVVGVESNYQVIKQVAASTGLI